MIPLLKTFRQLLGYVLITYLLLKTPLVGVFFIVQLPLVFKFDYCRFCWLMLDMTICTIIHGTYMRTISGWTGQHMDKYKRYQYQAAVIDWLLEKMGDSKNHCKRAYEYELSKKYVKQ